MVVEQWVVIRVGWGGAAVYVAVAVVVLGSVMLAAVAEFTQSQ